MAGTHTWRCCGGCSVAANCDRRGMDGKGASCKTISFELIYRTFEMRTMITYVLPKQTHLGQQLSNNCSQRQLDGPQIKRDKG